MVEMLHSHHLCMKGLLELPSFEVDTPRCPGSIMLVTVSYRGEMSPEEESFGVRTLSNLLEVLEQHL